MLDELVQVRGGRGYETAESLKARGEKPVPVEQALRDMRINRIFEGSTEIMHLLIAREAVDQHLQVAGDVLEADGAIRREGQERPPAEPAFYAKWLPQARRRRGSPSRTRYDEFGELAPYLRYAERSSRKLARSTFYAMTRWQAKLEHRQSFLGRIVDIGAELFAIAAPRSSTPTRSRASSPNARAEAPRAGGAVLHPGQAARRRPCSHRSGPTTTTPARRRPRACWTDATRGSRRALPTRRARAR